MALQQGSGAPGWLVGLLVVFALAAAVTYGLFVYRHAELSALDIRARILKDEIKDLRSETGRLGDLKPRLEKAVAGRAEAIAACTEADKIGLADIERLVQENKIRVAECGESRRRELKTYQDLMREAPARRDEVAKEEEQLYNREREFDEQRRKMRDDVEKVSQEIETVKTKTRTDNDLADRRIAELESRVRLLTSQVDINNRQLKSDGQIVAAESAADGFVVIDRGHRHSLRRGTRFTVYNRRGGQLAVKGSLEVVQVDERISTCRVLEEKDRNDPFIPGDHLHNPIYDPDKVKTFCIRGDFHRFSRAELGRFIEEAGGKVRPNLGVDVDYLVAGLNSATDTDQAVKLGISILGEEQLLDFVRPAPVYASLANWEFVMRSAAAGKGFVLRGIFSPIEAPRIVQFLRAKGAQVVDLDDPQAAVLVAGAGAADDMAAARGRGLVVIDQSQFAHIDDVPAR